MARATKTEHVGMGMFPAEVRAVRDLTPHLRRITLGSQELTGFRDDGPDQRFKLLLPRDHQSAPLLPGDGPGWYVEWQQMPIDVRPIMRTYTIRRARPTDGEVDVDVVVHGETGPGSRWALHTRPGDRVGIYGAWAEYETAPDARQLIVGDHTALPAVAAICEQLTGDADATVIIEVTDQSDRIELAGPDDLRPCWLVADPLRPGAVLGEAVRGLDGPAFDYAWVAGEQSVVATLRRHLVRDRGMQPTQVMFMGYWRIDGAIDDLD